LQPAPDPNQEPIMDALFNVVEQIFDMARTFGPQEWAIISIMSLILGYMCLRGMSIR
jgi:hypothetical protein